MNNRLWQTMAEENPRFSYENLPGWWCNNHLEKYESQWEG